MPPKDQQLWSTVVYRNMRYARTQNVEFER